MKKILTVAGVALALTFGGMAAAKGGHGGGHHGMGHHMMKRVFSKLDLTEQQQEEIKGIMSTFKAGFEGKKESHMAFKEQMKALVQSETFDEAAARALIESKQAERTDAALAKARMKNQIWNVLDAEQQAKAEELMAKMKKRGKRFMHRMMGEEQ